MCDSSWLYGHQCCAHPIVDNVVIHVVCDMWLKLLYKEVLKQLEIVKSEALQDKMLVHY